MAFRPLTDAECGEANPVAKLTSHVTQDHTFADTHGHLFPGSSDQLVEQFLQETRVVPQTFRMDDLMREMHEIESQRSALPPIPASTVKDHLHNDEWAQQYIEDGKIFHETNHEEIWSQIASSEQANLKAFEDLWGAPHTGLAADGTPIQKSAQELHSSLDEQKFVYSKFMKFMKDVQGGSVNLEDGKLTTEEANAWSNEYLQGEAAENTEALSQNWADEHVKQEDETERYDDFWKNMQEEIRKAIDHETGYENPWVDEYEMFHGTQDYQFSEENPMFDVHNPLERGKALLENGDFPSAVLCFEAAVQKEPENAEAWFMLGKTQAENEQDQRAIPALQKCLQIEPENLDAIMALAVSYTNESYYNQACNLLLRWLKANPKYKDLVPPDMNLSWSEQKVVQDLYIKAAQRNPLDIDYEVQCGLGVLFNLTSEYDKAVDCFRAALSVKSEDARLWNRLGATLANGSKSEEAVDAYHRALQLAPGFIRARYNVGITCINLQAYNEAVEHFLTALNQQARGKDTINPEKMSEMSDTIWSTLRMCTSLMNRKDLKEFVDQKDLNALNKAFNLTAES